MPELLIVIGIIAVLLAILLPSVAAARNRAKAAMCLCNVRQLCLGMAGYVNDSGGKYPPNTTFPSPGQYWYDDGRIATYVSGAGSSSAAIAPSTGGVFVCPADEDAGRSYAMNYWASSKVDGTASPAKGQCFRATVRQASEMILVAECWSSQRPSVAAGWVAPATIGANGTPGQRFGGGTGLSPQVPTRGTGSAAARSPSELPFGRHRGRAGSDAATAPKGSVSIGYADGHADMRPDTDLVLPTGLSSLDSQWSPLDPFINN